MHQIEEDRIDAALAAGYELIPPGSDEKAWSEISQASLAAAELEW